MLKVLALEYLLLKAICQHSYSNKLFCLSSSDDTLHCQNNSRQYIVLRLHLQSMIDATHSKSKSLIRENKDTCGQVMDRFEKSESMKCFSWTRLIHFYFRPPSSAVGFTFLGHLAEVQSTDFQNYSHRLHIKVKLCDIRFIIRKVNLLDINLL